MSSITFFFIFIPVLAFVLLAVNLIFAPHNPYQEKNSAFECGFTSFLGQNRTQFSISFFIFALLFLLFDLEILLVYPYLVSSYTNEVYGLFILLIFLLALTLGFAFELGKKALAIDSRQLHKINNNSLLVTNKIKTKSLLINFEFIKSTFSTSKNVSNIMSLLASCIIHLFYNKFNLTALASIKKRIDIYITVLMTSLNPVLLSYIFCLFICCRLYIIIPNGYILYDDLNTYILVLYTLYFVKHPFKDLSSIINKYDYIIRFPSISYKLISLFKKHCFSILCYLFKILKATVIFRTILLLITLLLVFLGINNKLASIIVSCFVLMLILYCLFNAKNKTKFISRYFFNLPIVIVFWVIVKNFISPELAMLLLANNIVFILDDWDFIDLFEEISCLDLHNKCMGDPWSPPPGTNPVHYDYWTNEYDEEKDMRIGPELKDWERLQKNPSFTNYKDYILIKGVKYYSSQIQAAIKSNNKLISLPSPDEFPVMKGFISFCDAKYRYLQLIKNVNWSPQEYISHLKCEKDFWNMEYNTLKKVETYYLQEGLDKNGEPLTKDFKDTFEFWQKRQIRYYNCHHMPGIFGKGFQYDLTNFKFKVIKTEPFILIRDFFKDKNVYLEVKENKNYVQFQLLQMHYILEYFKDKNLDEITPRNYSKVIMDICKNTMHDVKHSTSVFNEYHKLRLNEMSEFHLKRVCGVYFTNQYYLDRYINAILQRDYTIWDEYHNKHTVLGRTDLCKVGSSKTFMYKGFWSTISDTPFYIKEKTSFYNKPLVFYQEAPLKGDPWDKKLQFSTFKQFVFKSNHKSVVYYTSDIANTLNSKTIYKDDPIDI